MAHVLIVDDEKLIRDGIHAMINRIIPGHECILAENGQRALDIVESRKIDLIISDIKMPIMNGMEFANELVKKDFRIPLIFLTGLEEFKLVQQAMRYGVIDYLLKPLNGDELKKVINTSLDYSLKSVGYAISEITKNNMEQFEFEIQNSLESLNKQATEGLINKIFDQIENKHYLCHELQRIINSFSIKHNIYGPDYQYHHQPLNIKQTIQITSELIDTLQENNNESSLIDIAKSYIKHHLHEPPTLVEVSEAVHLNPNYFSDYFKEKTGESFSKYVARLRIEKAKSLLKDTSIKIKDVASQTGYHDIKNFRKKFKSTVGFSPNQYRKNHKLLYK
ncbi:response regulator transcription factor [Saliterribacillus persicus]|uniref:Helix-turn-helix protein n=1 Tax=Saliterribacillus persicus TaxID=930114 RepID=A0A368YEP0_9BACI|nr:response regulator [Saliterribacillus persicus]RCW77347.1 helix-turn-helix protein [Saliterribacillus persicus]